MMTAYARPVPRAHNPIDYKGFLEKSIGDLEREISRTPDLAHHLPARWLAIQLLEGNPESREQLSRFGFAPALLSQADAMRTALIQVYGEDIDLLIADRRYAWIHHLVGEVMGQSPTKFSLSDQLDRVITHRWFGIPIFLVVMWFVFKLTIDISAPVIEWLDGMINGPIARGISALLAALGLAETWVSGLIVDGVLAGVGGLLAFVPVLLALYMVLSILEDSGYMARAAFVMDGLMMKMGLPGKSFLPMMVGFGCSVPAIYATRTLENEKDRLLTALLVPFMSCGARLPVYVLFAAIFFSAQAGLVVFSLYLFGVLIAIFLGVLLRKVLFADKEQTPLLMELPPYRLPDLKLVWRQTWNRITDFLKNAASLILLASVILWFLMAIPAGPDQGDFGEVAFDDSLFATLSGVISPVLQPLGFGSWEAGSALITGFVAKELVVTTIAQAYQWTDTGTAPPAGYLSQSVFADFTASSQGYPALAGLAFMIFVLLYTPCIAAVTAIRHELGSGWMWRSIFGQLAVAWMAAFLVFQGGKLLLGIG